MDSLRDRVKESIDFLARHRLLADAFILDFFVDDHWSTIPAPWRQIFELWDCNDLGSFLNSSTDNKCANSALPPSLVSFMRDCVNLSMPRRPVSGWLETVNSLHLQVYKRQNSLSTFYCVSSRAHSRKEEFSSAFLFLH